MPNIVWALLCERIEVENGKLNIYGVAGRIDATAFPIDIHRIHLTAQVSGAPHARHVITCSVDDGSSVRTMGNQVAIDLNHNGMAIAAITIVSFRISRAGTYTFAVVADGSEIGHVLLPVAEMAT